MALSKHLEKLLSDLRDLHHHLRKETYNKYKRINPFYEELFDWKERGEFWNKKGENGITIYNSTTIAGDAKIGENTWIGPFCSIDGSGGLSIGEHCSIATGCQILSHDTVKHALSGGKSPYEYSPIKIGDCCFLGSHVIVTKGVTIGDHCLIAAGAVITKDIPEKSIVAGVPGVIVGHVEIMSDGSVKLVYEEK